MLNAGSQLWGASPLVLVLRAVQLRPAARHTRDCGEPQGHLPLWIYMPLMFSLPALHLVAADSVAGKTSAVQRAASAPVPDEERSDITDDELEEHDDGEPDYDFIGRGTLKVGPLLR